MAPVNVIIFGPPASGKGSVSSAFKDTYALCHISTGDLLRARAKEDNDEARELQEIMKSGSLVPDNTVINLVKVATQDVSASKNGYLLDGFPRTAAQATTMFIDEGENKISVPNAVFILKVDFEILKERIIYRRIDPVTNDVYNIKTDEIPDEIKSRLIQRADDTEEALRNRVDTFESSCDEIVKILAKVETCKVFTVSATRPLEEVRKECLDNLHGVWKALNPTQAGPKQDAKAGSCCVIM